MITRILLIAILICFGVFAMFVGNRHLQQQHLSNAAASNAHEHIANRIAEGDRTIDLTGFPELKILPSNLAEVGSLFTLDLAGTKISDLSALAVHQDLTRLTLRDTWVVDLTPISSHPRLTNLDIGGSWVSDLSPLADMPSLERLDIGKLQVETLEPLTRANALAWVNLHKAYALDGSNSSFEQLFNAVSEVYNGSAFQQDYRPGTLYQLKVAIARWREVHNLNDIGGF